MKISSYRSSEREFALISFETQTPTANAILPANHTNEREKGNHSYLFEKFDGS
jgi:hypothetical protein